MTVILYRYFGRVSMFTDLSCQYLENNKNEASTAGFVCI